MAKFLITRQNGSTLTVKATPGASQAGLVSTAKALVASGYKAVTIKN
jgi:hypothetical protein